MKKSQIQVVSIVLILLIVATSSVVLFNWTQNFGEDLRNKNVQNPKIIGKDMKILGLEEKNGILNVIIRNPISGYKEIEKISLNGENCTMIGSNVITPQGISVIPIDCPTTKNINNVAIYTQYYILESSNSITQTGNEINYLNCIAPDSSIIAHLGSSTFYESSKSNFGESCLSEERVCTDGILNGSYTYNSCIEDIPVSTNSLLFDGVDDYLSWTPTQEGNRQKGTLSMWMKTSNIKNGDTFIFHAPTISGGASTLKFYKDSQIFIFEHYDGSHYQHIWKMNWPDFSEHTHILLSWDTTQTVPTNRFTLSINGVKLNQTATTPVLQNALLGIFESSKEIRLPYSGSWGGYLSEVNIIDGQALEPTNFAEFNNYGRWVPKEYNGSYGTNGVYLTFENSSNLGQDFGGNDNHWNVYGDPIQTVDIPENNFAVLNPLDEYMVIYNKLTSYSNGNLKGYAGSDAFRIGTCSFGIPKTGKWYFEVKYEPSSLGGYIGLSLEDKGAYQLNTVNGYFYFNGDELGNSGNNIVGGHLNDNDVLSFEIDRDNRKIYLKINGLYINEGNPVLENISQIYEFLPFFHNGGAPNIMDVTFNFGQTPFTYTPPEGYKTLSSKNLEVPTVIPSQGFDVITYTGTGSERNIEGLDFSPSLVWIKNRDQTDDHKLFDIVRGVTKYLESSTLDAQTTEINSLISFNSNGFTLGTGANGFNDLNEKFVSWNWKEGPEFGFDIVNGTHVNGEIHQHNLNKTPELMILKPLSGNHNFVYYKDFTVGNYLLLNTVGAKATATDVWHIIPNSTNFGFGDDVAPDTFIAYIFTSIEGFSKIGSYTGNGNVDGPFIYTGFKPKYVMLKRIDDVSSWIVHDTQINQFNPSQKMLEPDANYAQFDNSAYAIDILSNGFKIRNNLPAWNGASGSEHIYIAFAEYPLSTNY